MRNQPLFEGKSTLHRKRLDPPSERLKTFFSPNAGGGVSCREAQFEKVWGIAFHEIADSG